MFQTNEVKNYHLPFDFKIKKVNSEQRVAPIHNLSFYKVKQTKDQNQVYLNAPPHLRYIVA